MSAERTPIRRRLAIGRTSHSPPWRGRKAGHRSIVPPLAATLAATLAMRAGLAMARAARERRSVERRAQDRRLTRAAGEPLDAALRRMALGQLDIAIESLDWDSVSGSPEQAIHETRKALKRLRALLRLLEPHLGADVFAREDTTLTGSARRLAGARDTEVALETLDALRARHPGKLEGRGGVLKLRAQLLSEREDARRATLSDPAVRAQVQAELRACRVRVSAWSLTEQRGIELVQPGLARMYRQGRARYRRAARGRGERTRELHRWRKRVKDLRYVAQMLEVETAQKAGARPRKRRARRRWARARKDAAWLKRLERRAERLGEMLGEEHDLALLQQRVRAPGAAAGAGVGPRSRKTLRKLIRRRRRELRKAALKEGERLYRRSPQEFVRRVRRAQRPAEAGLS